MTRLCLAFILLWTTPALASQPVQHDEQAICISKKEDFSSQSDASDISSRFGFGNILMGAWSRQDGWVEQLQNSKKFYQSRIWGGESCRVTGIHGIVEENAVISAIHGEHDEQVKEDTPFFDVHTAAGVISAPSGLLTVLCDWDVQPRKPVVMENSNAIYQKIMKEYLASRGLAVGRVGIVQLFRIDLEGDGVDEVFICAQNMEESDARWVPDKPLAAGFPGNMAKDSYSVLLLRKIVGGKVMQLPLHEYVSGFAPDDSSWTPPVLSKLYQFADLNGDGVMEIITGTATHAGYTHHVFEVKDAKVQNVLSCGVGNESVSFLRGSPPDLAGGNDSPQPPSL